jgi:hypothetical protein
MPRKKAHKERMYQLVGEPDPGARFVGYARYSSDMQDDGTIESQKRCVLEMGVEQKHWVHAGWYVEPAHSAKYEEIERRPVFAQLLADAGVKFDAVLCFTNSRWSRNVAVTHLSLSQLRKKGVWWATTNEPWDIDKIMEAGFSLAHGLTAQIDHDYVVQLSKVTIVGKESRARDGYHNGQVPFGYARPAYAASPPGAPSTWKPPRVPVAPDPETFSALVKLGELAAAGWSDAAIADELAGYLSRTPRFGERALAKDTVAAIRRLWFPCEFTPGSGRGTIETPSGERVEGKHPAAWPYATWQRMREAKAAQYHRPTREAQRHAHEFSRIIVCASCRRPLRVQNYPSGLVYYRDTSAVRKLPCPTGGFLLAPSRLVLAQFDALLAAVCLPERWRELIAERCHALAGSAAGAAGRTQTRRAELEAERKRLVTAYSKGYLPEAELDAAMDRVLAELRALPPQDETRDVEERIAAALSAGETLTDIAAYWNEATAEERRDIVWALPPAEGLVYDLERRAIAGLLPRPDVLPVLALGLGNAWEGRADGGLWQRDLAELPVHDREAARNPPPTPPALSSEQQAEALAFLGAGQSLRKVGAHFGVSYGAIWRLQHGEKARAEREWDRGGAGKSGLEVVEAGEEDLEV